jgi:hypothetical protein
MAADTVTISITLSGPLVSGIVTPFRIQGNNRQIQCRRVFFPDPFNPANLYPPTMRGDPFCNRFKIHLPIWDATKLVPRIEEDRFFFTLPYQTMFARPWDENDPFYARAAAVWDAQTSVNKQAFIGFFLQGVGFNATFLEYRNGQTATLLAGGDPAGTATLTIVKK